MQQKQDFKRSLGQFFALQRPYRSTFIVILALITVFEFASISERWLFKEIVDYTTLFAAGQIGREILVQRALVVALIFGTVILIMGASKWLHSHAIIRIESRVMSDLKRKFFNHIIGLSHNFHTTHRTGSMIARLTRGGRAIERMMDVIFFNYVGTIVRFVTVLVALLFIGWQYSVIIGITACLFIGYSLTVQRRQFRAAEIANDVEDIEKGNISDILTNIDSIKFFGKEKAMKERYYELSGNTQRATLESWKYWPRLDGVQIVLMLGGTTALVWASIQGFIAGALTVGDVVFIYAVYGALSQPLYRFVQGTRDFYQGMADFQSLYQYDAIHNEIEDKPGAGLLTVVRGDIEYRSLRFAYHKRELFDNFSLKVPRNSKVALVGKSGSGKSTLVKLLYRLYDVQGGSVLIDGVDVRDVQQESLRSELAIVPQECILFDDTLYNNVLFSRPDATKAEVLEAISLAQLSTLVSQLPNKESTIVGERGVRLSGGEKQRVSIARAILADRRILVLDEATSSLDSETEQAIQTSLKTLMKGRTTVIIAHRLSTIMQADVIVVMDRGKIVQTGKHKQLIKKRGPYQDLWNLQRGGYLR